MLVRNIAQSIIGNHPRLGLVGRTTIDEKDHSIDAEDDDVVEGIVLMRKYEQSLPTSKLVLKKLKHIEDERKSDFICLTGFPSQRCAR
jgi:cobalt-zinc-cadmium resistance protein CzcA